MRHIWIGLVVTGFLVGVAPAWGQKAEEPSAADIVKAKQLYRSAMERKRAADELAGQGDAQGAQRMYGQAARDYLEAYRLSNLPAFLYNLGSIYRLRGERQWAIRCYRAFLVSEPEDEKDIQDALTFINELKRELRASPEESPGDPALEPVGVCIDRDEPVAGESDGDDDGEGDGGGEGNTGTPGPEPGGAQDLGAPVDSGESRPGNGYRIGFWASAGVTAVSAVVSGVTLYQVYGPLVDDKQDAIDAYDAVSGEPRLDTIDACSDAENRLGQAAGNEQALLESVVDACNTGKSRATLSNIFQGVTVVGLVATGFFFYKGYLSKSGTGESAAGTAHVTPVVGPGVVGAEFTLRF